VGTLVGAAIALGIQYNSTLPGVSTSVYIVSRVPEIVKCAYRLGFPHHYARTLPYHERLQYSLTM
jgi:hypothetical protein